MYLVSACLAGINCRYNGKSSEQKEIIELVKEGKAVPVCPELLAGLQTPRPCSEIINPFSESRKKKVVSKAGQDLSSQFRSGAQKTLAIAKIIEVDQAILKSRSPSCGYNLIYDGTFSGNLVQANGITADLLEANGIKIYNEHNFGQSLA